MQTRNDRWRVIALCLAPMTFLPVGAALADNSPMSGGMMGNGTWYGAGTIWLPTLVVVVLLVAVLVAVLRPRK
jgi:uncharacterized membrane protein YhdT